jgi:putative RecB family exonuclease
MALPLPTTLTPSKVGKFVSCPLAFRYSYIERIPEPTTTYQLRGTIIHRVLQALFGLAAATRTYERAMELFDVAWAAAEESGELGDLELSEAAMRSFRIENSNLIAKYFALEDPSSVTPVGIELDLRVNVDGVDFRGIIDRLDRLSDGRFAIVDYKTGRSPRADRSRSRMLGVNFYAFLCERLLGIRPSEVRLMYLGDQVVVVESPTEQSLRGLHLRANAVWGAIERACDSGDFRPSPSPLCKSCSYQAMCPAYGAVVEAQASLIVPEPLAVG